MLLSNALLLQYKEKHSTKPLLQSYSRQQIGIPLFLQSARSLTESELFLLNKCGKFHPGGKLAFSGIALCTADLKKGVLGLLHRLSDGSTVKSNTSLGTFNGKRIDRFLGHVAKIPEPFRRDATLYVVCLLYTSPSPRDVEESRMPSSA